MTHWLSLAIWIPIGFGVAILAAGRDRNLDVIRAVALIGCVFELLATIPLYTKPTFIAYRNTFANVRDNSTSEGPFFAANTWGQKTA